MSTVRTTRRWRSKTLSSACSGTGNTDGAVMGGVQGRQCAHMGRSVSGMEAFSINLTRSSTVRCNDLVPSEPMRLWREENRNGDKETNGKHGDEAG